MIDKQLFHDFNRKVNGDSYFTLSAYRNKNGKNQWSCICACMDWISVTMDYLSSHEFQTQNINVMSMQVYTYISSIDIIWQSIQQLHRVIVDDKTMPFKGERSIFKDNAICIDDNEYFKHIRAVFGAHPVNLNDKNGKWFASWPTTGIYTQYDFAVSLYSANSSEDSIVFGFKFEELNDFLKSRYNYLSLLTDALDKQYKKFSSSLASELIPTANTPLEQLKILEAECKRRLDNDYYKYTIEDLIILFEADCSLECNRILVTEYRSNLLDLIQELKNALQQMNFDELKYGILLDSAYPQKIHYHLSKIYECLRGSTYDFMFDHYVEVIGEFLQNHVTLNSEMDNKELFLLIKTGLFNYSKFNNT